RGGIVLIGLIGLIGEGWIGPIGLIGLVGRAGWKSLGSFVLGVRKKNLIFAGNLDCYVRTMRLLVHASIINDNPGKSFKHFKSISNCVSSSKRR
ncbi:MAG: hypothetical protein K2K92_05050, partial [Duncaniella sp.]|nr:hypothetical protein [Duncaniella sp.]